jgi:hypothetical protein
VSRAPGPSVRYRVSVEDGLPRRRRPSSVVGGAALVLVSAVLVAGGAFALGFAALAVGGALLLRPARPRGRVRAGLPRRAGRGVAGVVWTGVGFVAVALRWGARRLGEAARALGRGAAIAAPHVSRRARTVAHWTSQRGRRAAGDGRIWVGRAGGASYRVARVGGRRGGAAVGSTARGAGSLAVAAGARARTTALSEAAHLGTVTLVPVALERDRGHAPDSGVEDATRILAEGSGSSVAASRGDDLEARTAGSPTERFVDASPRAGEPTAGASLPAPRRAAATDHTVVASAPVSSEKRAGGSKRASSTKQGRSREAVGEAQGEADTLDVPPGAADAPARGTSDWGEAPTESVTEVQDDAGPVAPAAVANEATDVQDAPAGEASDRGDASSEPTEGQDGAGLAPAAGTNEATDVQDAPAGEASDWADAPNESVAAQGDAGPRAPSGANEATDVQDAPAGEASDRADAPDESVAPQGDAGQRAPSGGKEEPKNATRSPAKDASVALAAEASDRADDATMETTESKARSRKPSETIRGASEKGASAAQPKSRTRKRSVGRGGVASTPTEPGSADDNADTAGGTPRTRKRTKRTPRTTTPQGERTSQQSR